MEPVRDSKHIAEEVPMPDTSDSDGHARRSQDQRASDQERLRSLMNQLSLTRAAIVQSHAAYRESIELLRQFDQIAGRTTPPAPIGQP
jgi:hypothetical protein